MTKSKYYCDLDEGKTKDGLDIHTLHWISGQIIEIIKSYHETYGDADIHRYAPVLRILSDELNKEIGT